MEDYGHSSNQKPDSIGEKSKQRRFKLPLNYKKIKKEAQKASDFSSLIVYFNEHASFSDDTTMFCRSLLQHEKFNSFKTIHFFKHEKGQSFAQKDEITFSESKSKDFHVNEFNQLFQRIKKSKNRTFGQESLKGFNFGILGTFLAREFSLGNHNIILIASRNDFLNQTKEEKRNFSKVMKVIAPYFDIILTKELEAQQLKNINLALSHLPFKIEYSQTEKKGYKKLPSNNFFSVKKNETLDRADVFHQERIALLGELLNTLKHELSNPLFGLQLSAELLLSEIKDPESAQFMKEIRSSIKRSQSIITNFTELYTSSETISLSDLEKLVHEVFTLTKSESRHINKSFLLKGANPEKLLIKANSVWLAQILFNLVVNSAQALNHAKTREPQIKVTAFLKDSLEIHIQDNGPGASSEIINSMFNPFFTTKDKGTGLGLAISQSLAKKLNGEIEYISEGQGAHFILRLAP